MKSSDQSLTATDQSLTDAKSTLNHVAFISCRAKTSQTYRESALVETDRLGRGTHQPRSSLQRGGERVDFKSMSESSSLRLNI